MASNYAENMTRQWHHKVEESRAADFTWGSRTNSGKQPQSAKLEDGLSD